MALLMGLSPLARGNRSFVFSNRAGQGPIPARAGQPMTTRRRTTPARAYPRSRGATALPSSRISSMKGLSPLARGNRLETAYDAVPHGPIPARAGQPSGSTTMRSLSGAYPRSRGATTAGINRDYDDQGLSPLARGNPRQPDSTDARSGPIPARAGQPYLSNQRCRQPRAYPRSRGATRSRSWAMAWRTGLSPLARGNRPGSSPGPRSRGPIPARAGQPADFAPTHVDTRAYPRSRGATAQLLRQFWALKGLSPLARGNLGVGPLRLVALGPIPARAGQPDSCPSTFVITTAYPRSRGATELARCGDGCSKGLSPLARGNRPTNAQNVPVSGPIPARAGQPRATIAITAAPRAYPRSRGATALKRSTNGLGRGLSPLARGNRSGPDSGAWCSGPIPARAGQP